MNDDSDFHVRTAAAADIPAVIALVQGAYRGESGLRGWTTETHLLGGQRIDAAGVAEAIAQPGSLVLLVERDAGLLACCHIEKHGEAAHFGMFAVDPECQRGGVGKQLMAHAEAMARRRWQARAMEMSVIEQRVELIAFYARRGYARTGQFQPFPYGDERFGIPRRDDLRFAVLRKSFHGENA